MIQYYSYDPIEFHFNGFVYAEEGEEKPENSTELVVPACAGDSFAKWNGEKWIVKKLVDGEWIDYTGEIIYHAQFDGRIVNNLDNEEIIEEPQIEGEVNE